MRRRRAWRTREAKRVLALTAAAGAATAATAGTATAATASTATAAAASTATDEHFRRVRVSHSCNTIAESAAPAIRFKVKTRSVGA